MIGVGGGAGGDHPAEISGDNGIDSRPADPDPIIGR